LRKKDHFEDLRTRCENYIKMDVKGTREGLDRIDVTQDRDKLWALEGTAINLPLP
jgi:hypothetical protein